MRATIKSALLSPAFANLNTFSIILYTKKIVNKLPVLSFSKLLLDLYFFGANVHGALLKYLKVGVITAGSKGRNGDLWGATTVGSTML